MKKYIITLIAVLGLVGGVYFSSNKEMTKEPSLNQDEIMLGQDTLNRNYVVVTTEEAGMKSILGSIVFIRDGQRTTVTRFNGSLEKLRETFRITPVGFSYTEFQSFGRNEYNSVEYAWKYDRRTGSYIQE